MTRPKLSHSCMIEASRPRCKGVKSTRHEEESEHRSLALSLVSSFPVSEEYDIFRKTKLTLRNSETNKAVFAQLEKGTEKGISNALQRTEKIQDPCC